MFAVFLGMFFIFFVAKEIVYYFVGELKKVGEIGKYKARANFVGRRSVLWDFWEGQ
jgi:hypothetical protein